MKDTRDEGKKILKEGRVEGKQVEGRKEGRKGKSVEGRKG